MADSRNIFVDYETAQKLIPFFQEAKYSAPMTEARRSASRIIYELEKVRDIDYSPVPGYQVMLSNIDYQFLMDTIEAMGL